MRRLLAGALSAVCPVLAVLAPLCLAAPGGAAEPCPDLVAVTSDAPESDPKAAEIALEAARARCGAAVASMQSAVPAPSFDTEVEPNDVPGTPTTLSFVNGVAIVTGEINGPGDVDFYRIFPPSAGRVWIQTDTGGPAKPGATSRDTVMDVYGQDGVTLIENDDDDGSGTGGDNTVETRLASSVAGLTTPGTALYIRIRAFGAGDVIRPYRIVALFTATAATPETEANNTAATADVLTPPLALVSGSIGAAGDSDYFSMALLAGSVLVVSADADPNRDGVGTDLVLEIRDPADQLIVSIDSSITGSVDDPASEAATYTVPADGTYYVRVRNYSPTGTGAYDLAVGTAFVNPVPFGLQLDGPGNGVWEPGETVEVRPSWSNAAGAPISLTGVPGASDGTARRDVLDSRFRRGLRNDPVRQRRAAAASTATRSPSATRRRGRPSTGTRPPTRDSRTATRATGRCTSAAASPTFRARILSTRTSRRSSTTRSRAAARAPRTAPGARPCESRWRSSS